MSLGKTSKYEYISLRPADNGFILEYTEVMEKPGSLDQRTRFDRNKVYGDSDEELDKAMAQMKMMYKFNKAKKGGGAPDLSMPMISEG